VATPVAWATLDELKILLGIGAADVANDAVFTQVLDLANEWAYQSRQDTALYPDDDPAVPPSAAVTGGVLGYALIQLRDRGYNAGTRMAVTPGFDTPTMAAVNSQLGLGGGGFA